MTIAEKKAACKQSLKFGDRIMIEWNPAYDEHEMIYGRYYGVVHRNNRVIVEVGDSWPDPDTGETQSYRVEIPIKKVMCIRRLTKGSGSRIV
jgi:hypothetical protein